MTNLPSRKKLDSLTPLMLSEPTSARLSDLENRLPRLLVVSDISVDRTAGGGLVLYRLLRNYPPGKLMVVSRRTDDWSHPIDRVSGAEYCEFAYRIPRLLLMRFNPFWPILMAKYIRWRSSEVVARATAFRPQAVLSVAHDFLWFLADEVATCLQVPLHLILHDDWPTHRVMPQPKWIRPLVQKGCDWVFSQALRRAKTRFCVSKGMNEWYEKRYGIHSQVLLPSRGEDSPEPCVRVRAEASGPLVVAYCGVIHYQWTADSLRSFADILDRLGGRLDLYVPHNSDSLAMWNLVCPNVRLVGFFPAHQMAKLVSESACALFLPASFGERERVDVATLFPSKLADYTAIGLPILVWGPEYSSAARWAVEHPGATELVIDSSPDALEPALSRLKNLDYAQKVAAAGVAAGVRDFDLQAVRRRFFASLAGAVTA